MVLGLVGARDLGPSKFIAEWDCVGAKPAACDGQRDIDGADGRPGADSSSSGGNRETNRVDRCPGVEGKGGGVGMGGGISGGCGWSRFFGLGCAGQVVEV